MGKRVLIISTSVGAGHNQAARALADRLRADGDPSVEVIDTLDFAPLLFRAYYAGGYTLAVTRFPRIYGLGFRLGDRPQGPRRSPRERSRLWTERLCLRGLRKFIRQDPPDLIVNTHFLAAGVIGHEIAKGRLHIPQVVVVTDILMHRFWYVQNVDHWFVPAERTAERLRRWGIQPHRITVSGIPIHPKWTAPLDREKVLAEWNLPADRPIVLLAGGAEFTCAPVEEMAQRIARECGGAFVAVLAGRNKDLLARLSQLPEAGRDVVGIAFTDRVHELVAVCSLMATKAGGVTTAECLAKGTPMVILRPVPGQEAGNAEHFAEAGAAVITRNVEELVAEVRRLLGDARELERMSENVRNLYRPAGETIAEAVRSAVCGQ